MVGVNSMEQEAAGSSKQLLIKLKIPKLEGVVADQDDDELEEGEIREEPDDHDDIRTTTTTSKDLINPPIQNKDVSSLNPIIQINKDNIRVCPECFKEFSSGKALGGHMRIHAQQQPNPHKKNHHHPPNKLKPVQAVRFKKTQFKKAAEKSDQQPYYLSKCIDENGRPVCKHCGKNFPSMKSLFGHMRCHPEREWRGILPPDHDHQSSTHQLVVVPNRRKTSLSSSSLSSTDDDDDDDMPLASSGDDDSSDVDLPTWSVRAKRGRRVEISPELVSVSSEEEEEEVQLLDAVEDLLMLAKGDHQSIDESGLTHKQQRIDEFEATNSNSLTIKDDWRLKSGEGKKMSENDSNYKNLSDNELSDSNDQLLTTMNSNSVSCSTPPNKMMMMRKRKKMKLMMDLEPGLTTPPPPDQAQPAATATVVVGATTTTPDKYKCSTCNKTFPTHQALGGHRSSHNKFKITIFNAVVDKDIQDHDHDDEEDHGSNDNNVNLDENAKESAVVVVVAASSSTTSTHQCTICNKVFPTGQALGGHKRCHWTAPPPAAADHHQAAADPPSSQVVTSYSPGEMSHTAAEEGPRRVLDFDLNEEPPMEEDEGGGDNASSSSYNSNIGN